MIGAGSVGVEEECVVFEDEVGPFGAGGREGGRGGAAGGDGELHIGVADGDIVGIGGRGHGDDGAVAGGRHGQAGVGGAEVVGGREGERVAAGRVGREGELRADQNGIVLGSRHADGDGGRAGDVARKVEVAVLADSDGLRRDGNPDGRGAGGRVGREVLDVGPRVIAFHTDVVGGVGRQAGEGVFGVVDGGAADERPGSGCFGARQDDGGDAEPLGRSRARDGEAEAHGGLSGGGGDVEFLRNERGARGGDAADVGPAGAVVDRVLDEEVGGACGGAAVGARLEGEGQGGAGGGVDGLGDNGVAGARELEIGSAGVGDGVGPAVGCGGGIGRIVGEERDGAAGAAARELVVGSQLERVGGHAGAFIPRGISRGGADIADKQRRNGHGGGGNGHGDGLRITPFAVRGGEDEVIGAGGVGVEEEGVVFEDEVGPFGAVGREGGRGGAAGGDGELHVGVADGDGVGGLFDGDGGGGVACGGRHRHGIRPGGRLAVHDGSDRIRVGGVRLQAGDHEVRDVSDGVRVNHVAYGAGEGASGVTAEKAKFLLGRVVASEAWAATVVLEHPSGIGGVRGGDEAIVQGKSPGAGRIGTPPHGFGCGGIDKFFRVGVEEGAGSRIAGERPNDGCVIGGNGGIVNGHILVGKIARGEAVVHRAVNPVGQDDVFAGRKTARGSDEREGTAAAAAGGTFDDEELVGAGAGDGRPGGCEGVGADLRDFRRRLGRREGDGDGQGASGSAGGVGGGAGEGVGAGGGGLEVEVAVIEVVEGGRDGGGEGVGRRGGAGCGEGVFQFAVLDDVGGNGGGGEGGFDVRGGGLAGPADEHAVQDGRVRALRIRPNVVVITCIAVVIPGGVVPLPARDVLGVVPPLVETRITVLVAVRGIVAHLVLVRHTVDERFRERPARVPVP